MKTINVAVLVSGGGSNLQALIDKQSSRVKGPASTAGRRSGDKLQNYKISLVISNNPEAYALERAKKARIETLILAAKKYKKRLEYAKALVRELKKRDIDVVCLAGFMLILHPYFIRNFRNCVLNIHPALLPAFGGEGMYGLHVHEAVLKSKAKVSGCTVHFVDEGCDTGPVILQKKVPVLRNDTPDMLAKRILKYEHKIYPQALKLFASGKLRIKGKRAFTKQCQSIKVS